MQQICETFTIYLTLNKQHSQYSRHLLLLLGRSLMRNLETRSKDRPMLLKCTVYKEASIFTC